MSLSFYQRSANHLPSMRPQIVDEIVVYDPEHAVDGDCVILTLHQLVRPAYVAVKAEVLTDSLAVFRWLDKLGALDAIERANRGIQSSDDVARLLVSCGLEHVPYSGSEFAPDLGASEQARIKELHSS